MRQNSAPVTCRLIHLNRPSSIVLVLFQNVKAGGWPVVSHFGRRYRAACGYGWPGQARPRRRPSARSAPLRPDEFQKIGVQPRYVGEHQPVRRTFINLETAIGNELRHLLAGELDRRRGVLVALEKKCRHADAWQLGPE